MRRSVLWLLVLAAGLISGLTLASAPMLVSAHPALQTGAASDDPVVAGAGDISECNNDRDLWTGALLDKILPGTVLALGDNANDSGTPAEYRDCFGPTWGRYKDRIKPIPGNRDYLTGGGFGYYDYFGDVATPLEPGCRKECGGYYSYDVGTWHMVALNSEINGDPGSPQEQWLRADLAAHPSVCTLAYWHKPRFSSGLSGGGAGQGLFQALYDYGADVVLSGHDHDYERFAPQDPNRQYAPDRGIRQFVVGTGGDSQRDYTFIQPNSEVRNSETWGVIKLTLHPTSYDWQFIPIDGQTFTDAGSSPCVTAPGVPTERTAAVVESTPVVEAVAEPALSVSDDATELIGTTTTEAATLTTAATTLPAGGATYTIQSGDTLFAVALRYGLTWTEVAAANGLTEDSLLQIGQVIRLPGVEESTTSTPGATTAATITAATTATTTVATTGTAPSTGAVNGASTATGTTTTSGPSEYTVNAGDTLFGIALRNNVTRKALADANGLREDALLLVGQKLTIPGAATIPVLSSTGSAAGVAAVTTTTGTTQTVSSGAASAALTATPKAAVPAATASTRYYTVKEGDTVISIALDNNLDWQELLRLNGLTEASIIQIGQRIRLN